jgi:hypothetical protein
MCRSRDQPRTAGDLRPRQGYLLTPLAGRMFVADEFPVDLSFPVARARLARMAAMGWLASALECAHGDGVAEVIRIGPRRAGAGIPELAGVHYRTAASDESAVLAVRWEAAGPGVPGPGRQPGADRCRGAASPNCASKPAFRPTPPCSCALPVAHPCSAGQACRSPTRACPTWKSGWRDWAASAALSTAVPATDSPPPLEKEAAWPSSAAPATPSPTSPTVPPKAAAATPLVS